jgi:hypothetical protein
MEDILWMISNIGNNTKKQYEDWINIFAISKNCIGIKYEIWLN